MAFFHSRKTQAAKRNRGANQKTACGEFDVTAPAQVLAPHVAIKRGICGAAIRLSIFRKCSWEGVCPLWQPVPSSPTEKPPLGGFVSSVESVTLQVEKFKTCSRTQRFQLLLWLYSFQRPEQSPSCIPIDGLRLGRTRFCRAWCAVQIQN